MFRDLFFVSSEKKKIRTFAFRLNYVSFKRKNGNVTNGNKWKRKRETKRIQLVDARSKRGSVCSIKQETEGHLISKCNDKVK